MLVISNWGFLVITIVVAPAALLLVHGSNTPVAGTAIVAFLVTTPAGAVAATLAVIVKVATPPLGRVGITKPAPCIKAIAAVPGAVIVGHTALPDAEQVSELTVRLATTGDLKIAPLAALLAALLVLLTVAV